MEINFLKAFNGDSIWISFVDNGKPRNILIDGGTSTTYSYKDKIEGKIKAGDLKTLIENLEAKNENLDLVILTHIDDDHIDGFLKWFGKDKKAITYIKEIYFNSGRTIKKYLNNTDFNHDPLKFKEETELTSVAQGVDFEEYIKEKGVWNEDVVKQTDIIIWNRVTFQILSPNTENLTKLLEKWEEKDFDSTLDTSRKNDYKKTLKELAKENIFEEDNDPFNGSSISFILIYEDKKYLFLGDSHPSDIVTALDRLGYNTKDNKLKVELFKLSHHGSQKNTSTELLDLIDTSNYIVSTNGDLHNHPDKATIARIVESSPSARIYFNYPELISKLILEKDRTDYPNVKFLATQVL